MDFNKSGLITSTQPILAHSYSPETFSFSFTTCMKGFSKEKLCLFIILFYIKLPHSITKQFYGSTCEKPFIHKMTCSLGVLYCYRHF